MKMIAKKPLLLTIFTILLVMFLAPAAFATTFPDMPNDWSKPALENAVNNGLLGGIDGKLMPEGNLTRAQMATVLNRAFGATEKASLTTYTDVSANDWYYADMTKAVQMGTFNGSDNKLYPGENINRGEAFVALARAFKLSGASESVLNQFSDKDQISSWATDGIASLVAAGYINGSDGKLNPTQSITRAEFAQIMNNLITKYIKSAGTYTSSITGNLMVNAPAVILKNITITGDLIIGDGVGDGDVTLDNVVVTGRTIIRGGGVNSIKILGTSKLQKITIARVDGKVRVYAEDGTEIGEVIADGKDDVIIEGNVGTVTIDAPGITVTATNADIESATINGDNSTIVFGDKSTVGKVTVNATNSNITALKGSKITDIVVNSAGANISGAGDVGKVEANASNVTVTTIGTRVTAAIGTTGVTAGGTTVAAGTSATVTSRTTSSSSGGGSSNPDSIIIKIGDQTLNIEYTSGQKLLDVLDSFVNDSSVESQINTKVIAAMTANLADIKSLNINGKALYSASGWTEMTEILSGTGYNSTILDLLHPTDYNSAFTLSYLKSFITNYKTLYAGGIASFTPTQRTTVLNNFNAKATNLTRNLDSVTCRLVAKDIDSTNNVEIGRYFINNIFMKDYTVDDFFNNCGTGATKAVTFTVTYGSTTKTLSIYYLDN